MNHRTEHAKARSEAFAWYRGAPPSVDEARRHFSSRAKQDPANTELYAEALEIFLATCWNIHPTHG